MDVKPVRIIPALKSYIWGGNKLKKGESVFAPATNGIYSVKGKSEVILSYVP